MVGGVLQCPLTPQDSPGQVNSPTFQPSLYPSVRNLPSGSSLFSAFILKCDVMIISVKGDKTSILVLSESG